MHLPNEQKISVLKKTANSEQLLAELEKRDMYCMKCHQHEVNEFVRGIPVPPLKPFSVI
jgi:hypothetical protein